MQEVHPPAQRPLDLQGIVVGEDLPERGLLHVGLPAAEERTRGDKLAPAGNDAPDGDHAVPATGRDVAAKLSAPQAPRPVGADVHVRMRLQRRHLLRELVRVGPVVVALAQRHIAAPDQRIQEGLRDADPPGILVLRLVDAPDQAGEELFVMPDDVRRAIGGGVVVDDHLEAPRRLLRGEPVEGVADVVCMIVGQADDGDHNLIHRSR